MQLISSVASQQSIFPSHLLSNGRQEVSLPHWKCVSRLQTEKERVVLCDSITFCLPHVLCIRIPPAMSILNIASSSRYKLEWVITQGWYFTVHKVHIHRTDCKYNYNSMKKWRSNNNLQLMRRINTFPFFPKNRELLYIFIMNNIIYSYLLLQKTRLQQKKSIESY